MYLLNYFSFWNSDFCTWFVLLHSTWFPSVVLFLGPPCSCSQKGHFCQLVPKDLWKEALIASRPDVTCSLLHYSLAWMVYSNSLNCFFSFYAFKLSTHRNQVWMPYYHFLGWLVLLLYSCQVGEGWKMGYLAAFWPHWWLCLGFHPVIWKISKGYAPPQVLGPFDGFTCSWSLRGVLWRYYQS